MLVRAAGRRPPVKATSKLAATLVPHVLPPQPVRPCRSRWKATHTRSPSEGRRATVRPATDLAISHVRSLASIAGPAEALPQASHYPALEDGSRPEFRWDYPSHSPSDPLTLDLDHEPPPPRRSHLGTTTADLLQNLYACIRVGRFDRSESIIKRLVKFPEANEGEIMYAHEVYLEARYQQISASPGPQANFAEMRKWFDYFSLGEKDDPVNVSIIMLKATIASCDALDRQQYVEHYTAHSGLPREEILEDEEFSDQEASILRSIYGSTNLESQTIEPSSDESDDVPPRYILRDEDVPQILEVAQRGTSMPMLKTVLEYQKEEYNSPEFAASLEPRIRESRDFERQRLLETIASKVALENWKAEDQRMKAMGLKSVLSNKPVNALLWQWYQDLVPLIQAELDKGKRRTGSGLMRPSGPQQPVDFYGIYIEGMTAETLALNTVLFLMSTSFEHRTDMNDNYSPNIRLATTAKTLGAHLEVEHAAELARRHARSAGGQRRKRKISGQAQVRLDRRRSIARASSAEHVEWPVKAKLQLGIMLISHFLAVAKMPVTREHPRTKQKITKLRSAFTHKIVYFRGRRQSVVLASVDLRQKVLREPLPGIHGKRLPMLTEPQPWTGFKKGGYLSVPTKFVRLPPGDRTPRDYATAAIQQGHMKQVFDAINALGKIPWRINEFVLRVQIEAWNTGKPVGNFAELDPQFEYPPEPSVHADPHARSKWMLLMQEIENKKAGLHSQRCHQNLQLELARGFRNDKIYFPHNVDFRGRAYPVPPYLNHMGADNVRALMLFDTGKELGEAGLRWLKIHLANVFGYDKASFSEREEFVMRHIDDVFDSVDKPLDGRRWWLKSEDAWQTLAACAELKAALESADPTKYVSHLPLHQDGTCNGLQHYAALGGDEVGARQVNLEPGDRPSDVYTAVADGVIAAIKQDLRHDNPIAQLVDGLITRKVVKQPVMTNVYGVTYYGARAQVKKQLEDIFPHVKSSDLINHQTIASYIAKKIFNSLGEMFRGAQAIQEWLGICADRISTSITAEQIAALERSEQQGKKGASKKKEAKRKGQFKSTVIWTTPLRFPVVQPYREASVRIMPTTLSHVTISEPQAWDPVSRRKQMQGFPPNFIHSLDATHMMLSAIKCEEKGITFASIHDSFWTHACDRDRLSDLLRDAFVHMHREDIVGRLKEEFEARYKGCLYQASVEWGSKIGKLIREWRAGKEGAELGPNLTASERELILERRRQTLLASEDEAERQKGLDMVTPASIWAAAGGNHITSTPTGLAASRLGHAPDDCDAVEEPELEDEKELDADAVSTDLAREVHEPAQEDDVTSQQSHAPGENGVSVVASEAEEGEQLSELEFRRKWLGTGQMPSRSTRQQKKMTTLWVPLEFPAVPKKGSFDVRRLKQSKYFFH